MLRLALTLVKKAAEWVDRWSAEYLRDSVLRVDEEANWNQWNGVIGEI